MKRNVRTATAAELSGKSYVNIIAPEYQWSVWATLKDAEGKLDYHILQESAEILN